MTTIYNLIENSLKNKYFQSEFNPRIIIEFPDSSLDIRSSNNKSFLAYSPSLEKLISIPLSEISLYKQITKEQAEKIAERYKKGEMRDELTNKPIKPVKQLTKLT